MTKQEYLRDLRRRIDVIIETETIVEEIRRLEKQLSTEIALLDAKRIHTALHIASDHASTDGAHHKMWVIDQMVRALTLDGYEKFVNDFKTGDDGSETYEWDIGIVP